LHYTLGNSLSGPDLDANAKAKQIAVQNELLCQLVEGIGKNAMAEDPLELEQFQSRLAAEQARLKNAAGQDQMELAVKAIIELVARHNAAVKTDNATRSAELTRALRMMTDTIAQVSQSSQAAVHQLGVIEKGLAEATATNDITRLRSKLGVCLKMIREQSESMKMHSKRHVDQLKAFVVSSPAGQELALPEEPLDPVSGLPSRSYAENLIKERFEKRRDCLVGLVSVNRMASFQVRFGQAAVDDIIRTVSRQLVQRLPVGTTLCRWSPFSFVAVMDITSSYAETSSQWHKVGGLKVEKHIEHQQRTAFIFVGTSMMLERLKPASSWRELIQNLDRFVMQQSGEEVA
jgi:GGDEF domain-containing protein